MASGVYDVHESEWWDAITVEWEGDAPEPLFGALVDEYARGVGRILWTGCLMLPEAATGDVVALDVSRSALEGAAGSAGRYCVVADARSLPFADGVFDLVCSCPIPGAATPRAFEEIARVLRPGGALLGIVTGEVHRIETQEVFGRGIGWPPAKPVRFAIPEAIGAAGLEVSSFAEYFGAIFYPDIRSFALDLEALPIIPDFDASRDAALIREAQRKLTCERGIRDTEHVAVYAAWKAD